MVGMSASGTRTRMAGGSSSGVDPNGIKGQYSTSSPGSPNEGCDLDIPSSASTILDLVKEKERERFLFFVPTTTLNSVHVTKWSATGNRIFEMGFELD